MSEKIRGSDKLKMQCADYQALTCEEIEQVAGGASVYGWTSVFPRGIPWPELFMQNQFATNPVAQMGTLAQLSKFG